MIGNGPSGIALSYFLSGHWPYYSGGVSDNYLDVRLQDQQHLSLVEQDLEYLSEGLEGRSNNPVALLFDRLQRPEADLGLEVPSLLEWKHHKDQAVDHVVLGCGQPGGVWQMIEGDMLTVSLGAWMEMPNLSMAEWKASAKHRESQSRRATVSQVSQYYLDYVNVMGLENNFQNNSLVTGVRRVSRQELVCSQESQQQPSRSTTGKVETQDKCLADQRRDSVMFTLDEDDKDSDDMSFFSSTRSSTSHTESISIPSSSPRGCQSPAGGVQLEEESPPISGRYYPPNCDIFDECSGRDQSMSLLMSQDIYANPSLCPTWDPILNPSLFSSSYIQLGAESNCRPCEAQSFSHLSTSCRRSSLIYRRSISCPVKSSSEDEVFYEVTGFTLTDTGHRGKPLKYLTKNVVLATGMTTNPRNLDIPGEHLPFVFHSLNSLEEAVRSGGLTSNSDPVLIVGAGLSAADAIINTQGHNIPIVHCFRRPVDDPTLIFNKLPEAIYPEYHEVHRMMAAGTTGTTRMMRGQPVEAEYPAYRAFSETELTEITANRRVRLRGPATNELMQVSYVVILIGASADLNFLEESGTNLGLVPGEPIERNNPVDIDVFTHECINSPGMYAMGPITGDNFVRFLQGGALAITSHFHHKKKLSDLAQTKQSLGIVE